AQRPDECRCNQESQALRPAMILIILVVIHYGIDREIGAKQTRNDDERDQKPKSAPDYHLNLRPIYHLYNVGPMLQGANSSSPTLFSSLLVFLPDATAKISSKICRPTASTGVPSKITPASMSMSPSMCLNIGVLVATLMLGDGLQPKTEP